MIKKEKKQNGPANCYYIIKVKKRLDVFPVHWTTFVNNKGKFFKK